MKGPVGLVVLLLPVPGVVVPDPAQVSEGRANDDVGAVHAVDILGELGRAGVLRERLAAAVKPLRPPS